MFHKKYKSWFFEIFSAKPTHTKINKRYETYRNGEKTLAVSFLLTGPFNGIRTKPEE
jgi:hypothetical protein